MRPRKIIAMIMTFQYTKNEVQANVLYSISLGLAVMNIFVYFLINDIVTLSLIHI